MKKGLLGVIAVGLFVFLISNMGNTERVPLNTPLPDNPPFSISSTFDGDWSGKRIDISGDGICRQTRIVGTIQNGDVSLRLMYNNTVLKGWISEHGDLSLYADSQKWGYRFTGSVVNNRIEGEWKVTNAPCRGTWFIEKQ